MILHKSDSIKNKQITIEFEPHEIIFIGDALREFIYRSLHDKTTDYYKGTAKVLDGIEDITVLYISRVIG